MDILGSTKKILNNVINKAVKPYNISKTQIVICGNLVLDGVVSFNISELVVAEVIRGVDTQYMTFTEKHGDLVLQFTCLPTAKTNDYIKKLYKVQKSTKRYFNVSIFENGKNTESYLGCILSCANIEAGMESVDRTHQIGLIPLYDNENFVEGDTPEAVIQEATEGG